MPPIIKPRLMRGRGRWGASGSRDAFHSFLATHSKVDLVGSHLVELGCGGGFGRRGGRRCGRRCHGRLGTLGSRRCGRLSLRVGLQKQRGSERKQDDALYQPLGIGVHVLDDRMTRRRLTMVGQCRNPVESLQVGVRTALRDNDDALLTAWSQARRSGASGIRKARQPPWSPPRTPRSRVRPDRSVGHDFRTRDSSWRPCAR